MKFRAFRVYCLQLAPADFRRDSRRSKSGRAIRNFVLFCPVNNALFYRFAVSQISQNSHTIRGSVLRWMLSERVFENLPVMVFFSKKVNFCVKIFNDFRLQAATSAKWLQIAETHGRLARLRNAGFPFVPLESAQSDSPGLQAAHNERHSWTSLALPSSATDVMWQSFAWLRQQASVDVALLLTLVNFRV